MVRCIFNIRNISLDYGRCKFTLNHKGDQLIVGDNVEVSKTITYLFDAELGIDYKLKN